ncbi:hypothetical protein [Aureimonas phyllosphaerae]|uniref:Uncharacterized protein n=1 Tax=Aureimonas phyllosphaerae TaxID=1166078 RepID=A0A7W6BPX7_9HYPH|nr:hypothetical protein [Aureimonas phyllosphaerae]MBB3935929.1 hypothetical protein [Aureimonas phyllosphaerae]MBB3960346.1 hypothetical protein [Aureimonas phyllosphaerae]SFF36725.1 hypothetical protein SAMN05216566_109145 [Aureimonas phyllosphaerae]
MNKLFSFLIILVMILQIIRPIGLPGFRRRGDFWKLAIVAMVVFGLDVLLRPH